MHHQRHDERPESETRLGIQYPRPNNFNQMDMVHYNLRLLGLTRQQEVERAERENQIIGRYKTIPMQQILKIENVKQIIFASWVIYLKYQMVINRMIN